MSPIFKLIVSCKGMLVKSDSIWKLAIPILESKLWSSSANVKESLIVYSLAVKGSSIGTKKFVSLCINSRQIDLKGGGLSLNILWTLAKPYIIVGLEPGSLKSLHYSMNISLLALRFLRTSVTLFSIWIVWFKILPWSK